MPDQYKIAEKLFKQRGISSMAYLSRKLKISFEKALEYIQKLAKIADETRSSDQGIIQVVVLRKFYHTKPETHNKPVKKNKNYDNIPHFNNTNEEWEYIQLLRKNSNTL